MLTLNCTPPASSPESNRYVLRIQTVHYSLTLETFLSHLNQITLYRPRIIVTVRLYDRQGPPDANSPSPFIHAQFTFLFRLLALSL